jgi:hypothetical protein
MRKQSRLGPILAVLLSTGLYGSVHFEHHRGAAGSRPFQLTAAIWAKPGGVDPPLPESALAAMAPPAPPEPEAVAAEPPKPADPAPTPVKAAVATRAAGDAGDDRDAANFARLRQCESNGNYATNTGNGYYGAYQFSADTWHALGYDGLPSDAPPEVQDEAAHRLQARSGWGQWPACSRRLGLR